MASTVDTYGAFAANSIEVDSVVKFTGSTDDTKSISIQLAGNPTAAGNVVYTLPVITSGKTLATTDDVSSLPSSTNNQILVSNSGTYASVNVSGDLTNTAGAFTIANNAITTAKVNNGAITGLKLAADCIDGSKISDDAIDSEHIASGAIDTEHVADSNITLAKLENVNDGQIIVGNGSNRPAAVAVSGDITLANDGTTAIASGVIVNADVNASAAIAGSKISPDFGSQTVQTTGDVQTAANKAFRFGADQNGTWQIVIQAGGGALLFQKKESGAYVTKGSISS